MNRPLCILVAALAISAPSFRAAYAQGDADYGKIPLSFEANKGQTDGRVRYLARGAGYTVFLTPGETVLRLAHKSRGLSQGSVLRMRMIGAADSPSIEAEEQVESRSNYFLGADPATWRSGVAHFGRVRYRDVYPGIDAVYYGNQRQLEDNFVVAPGADPSAIRFAIEGADRVHVDSAGNLVISIAGGQLIQHRPRLYQVNGLAKTSVDGNYVLTSGRFVSFEVAGYNPSRPLVID